MRNSLTAARAIELRAPLTPSARSTAVIAGLREAVPGPWQDRFLAPEIAAATAHVLAMSSSGRSGLS